MATAVLRHARAAVLAIPAPPSAAAARLELAMQGRTSGDTPAAWAAALAAYDPHDGTATLMLHDPHARTTHLTHVMPHVRAVLLSAGPRSSDSPLDPPRDRTLVIEHDGGEAVVTFFDDPSRP